MKQSSILLRAAGPAAAGGERVAAAVAPGWYGALCETQMGPGRRAVEEQRGQGGPRTPLSVSKQGRSQRAAYRREADYEAEVARASAGTCQRDPFARHGAESRASKTRSPRPAFRPATRARTSIRRPLPGKRRHTPRYARADLDTATDGRPDLAPAVEALRAWNGDPWAVLLIGPAGTGKTWLAAGLARARLLAGAAVRFVPALDWLARCQAALNRGEAEDEYAAAAGYGGLLILDDLAAQGVGEWQQMQAVRLVDRRWRDELPTVVTTNETSAELRARYGQRLVDRLAAGLVIRLRGDSQRVAQGRRLDLGRRGPAHWR